jgi:hypothetical protein
VIERLDVFTSGDRFVVMAEDGRAVEYLVQPDGTLVDYWLGATSEPELPEDA